jgi:putative transposase
MMKNRHLAKSIQEQNFYRIRQLLIEKALNTQAVQIGIISTYYPSSKKCSKCGKEKKDLKLSDRVYICKYCGSVMDRDYNASINIRDCKEYELVDFADKKLYYDYY